MPSYLYSVHVIFAPSLSYIKNEQGRFLYLNSTRLHGKRCCPCLRSETMLVRPTLRQIRQKREHGSVSQSFPFDVSHGAESLCWLIFLLCMRLEVHRVTIARCVLLLQIFSNMIANLEYQTCINASLHIYAFKCQHILYIFTDYNTLPPRNMCDTKVENSFGFIERFHSWDLTGHHFKAFVKGDVKLRQFIGHEIEKRKLPTCCSRSYVNEKPWKIKSMQMDWPISCY